eukprot:UN27377
MVEGLVPCEDIKQIYKLVNLKQLSFCTLKIINERTIIPNFCCIFNEDPIRFYENDKDALQDHSSISSECIK